MAIAVGLKAYNTGLGQWVDVVSNAAVSTLNADVETNTAAINNINTNGVAKLSTGRTITLTGEVEGTSGTFDGSGNLSFSVAIAEAVKQAIINATLPIGVIMFYAKNATPTGYLKCNGDAVSRTTYANLFALIGTTFGVGDGSTTFNVPDMRGEFPRGYDDGRGVDVGRIFGSSQTDELKAHAHPVAGSGTNQPRIGAGSTGFGTVAATTTGADQPAQNSNSTGGVETRPRNVACLFIIKY